MQKNYEYTLKDSRECVNLNTTEITQCEKTIYTYIEMGLFQDWGATNLELRRKVTRKLRKEQNQQIIQEGNTMIT